MFIRGIFGGTAGRFSAAHVLLVVLALSAGLFANAAEANPKFAAITVDARNG